MLASFIGKVEHMSSRVQMLANRGKFRLESSAYWNIGGALLDEIGKAVGENEEERDYR